MEVNKLGMSCGFPKWETEYISGKCRKNQGQENRRVTEVGTCLTLLLMRSFTINKTRSHRPHPQNGEPNSTSHVFWPLTFDLMLPWMEPYPKDSQEQLQEELAMLHRDFPSLKREQLLEAKENLDRYFDLAVRIFLRLEKEKMQKDFDTSTKNS
jgi:hypothetical protein